MQDDGTSIADVRDQASGAISGLSAPVAGGPRCRAGAERQPPRRATAPPAAGEAAAPPIPPPAQPPPRRAVAAASRLRGARAPRRMRAL